MDLDSKSKYEILEEILEEFYSLRDSGGVSINSFGRESSSVSGSRDDSWDRIDQRIRWYIEKEYPQTRKGSSPVSKASSLASIITRKAMKADHGGEKDFKEFERNMEKFREDTGEEALSRVLEIGVGYVKGKTGESQMEKLSRQIKKAAG